MAKKFGKFVLFSAIAGAAAAGAYHYLQNKNKELCDDLDDCDDFDIFDDDLDDDFEYTPDASHTKSRPYVSLDLDNAKQPIWFSLREFRDGRDENIVCFQLKVYLRERLITRCSFHHREYRYTRPLKTFYPRLVLRVV